jgi:hypothetical protein
MVLNPYDLMGMTPNNTSQDVRKRYYALACLCHPDRGGTNEQMQTLHNAYQYVARQVELNSSVTYEQLEDDFEAFCKDQVSKPPTFSDIHADAFNLPRFNDLFANATTHIDAAFEKGGYATVASDVTLDYSPAVTGPIDVVQSHVVVYMEPSAVVMPSELVRDLSSTGPLAEFSCKVGKLCVADYRDGLSVPPPPPSVVPCMAIETALANMIQARRALDP